MNVLIIGSNGFSGYWLNQLLSNKDEITISGIDIHSKSKFELNGLYFQNLLNDDEKILEILKRAKPDQIYYFAGIFSDKEIKAMLDINLTCFAVFAHALKKYNKPTKLLITSSGAVYGQVNKNDLPLKENFQLNPNSYYGISKYMMENLATLLFENDNKIVVVVVRPSNLIGPYLNESLLPSLLVKQVKEIQKGIKDKIEVYNLTGKRDYIDVRDAVFYYYTILSKLRNFTIVNISRGKLHSVSDLIEKLSNITEIDLEVVTLGEEPSKEFASHSQNPLKLKNILGSLIHQEIEIDQSLRDMINSD